MLYKNAKRLWLVGWLELSVEVAAGWGSLVGGGVVVELVVKTTLDFGHPLALSYMSLQA